MRHHECFAVKAGINGFLDLSRKAFLDLVENMEELVASYEEKYDLSCTLHYRSVISCHTLSLVRKLPLDAFYCI